MGLYMGTILGIIIMIHSATLPEAPIILGKDWNFVAPVHLCPEMRSRQSDPQGRQ